LSKDEKGESTNGRERVEGESKRGRKRGK